MTRDARPLIAHVIHKLDVGGMENGLVNLINHLPSDRYRHAIVSLTDATDFAQRISRADVPIVSLGKRPGHDLGLHVRLFRAFRGLRPAIVHTRNLATFEAVGAAAAALVPYRVHGEHGRDMQDPEGTIRFVSVNDLSVGRNVDEVLRVLDALQTDELCPCNWKKGEKTLG